MLIVRKFRKGKNSFQPLSDNLESSTYEVFEKDPVKYSEYHKAIYAALMDRITDEEAKAGKTVSLMVLGAGRGPLVRQALKAGEISGRKLKVKDETQFLLTKLASLVINTQ